MKRNMDLDQCYEEFERCVISLFEITEDIDFLGNHPDRRIATAMEVVIQISNIYEDGCHKISREMYSSLDTAVTILGQARTLDKKVNSFYEKGCAYLRIYRPGIFTGI